MDKIQILDLLYNKKDYSKIKELLKNSKESWSFNILARIYLDEGNVKKAYKLYDNSKNIQGMGYCLFLNGEIQKAKDILLEIKDSSSFVNWLLFIIELISGNIEFLPTFMQIRNFYEQDLEMLFITKNYETAQKIIDKNSFLENFNREIYKYSARVLFNNYKYTEAKTFLTKSLDICYNDPETHHMLAEIYEKTGDRKNAILELQKAIEIPGGYMPSSKRLKDLLF